MTEEEICKEPTGERLDAWVAEALGWTDVKWYAEDRDKHEGYYGRQPGCSLKGPHRVWAYSTDWSDFGEALEQMIREGWWFKQETHWSERNGYEVSSGWSERNGYEVSSGFWLPARYDRMGRTIRELVMATAFGANVMEATCRAIVLAKMREREETQ